MTLSEWISDLTGIMGEEKIFVSDDELTAYSYDWWPVARKWFKQEKRPYKADVVVRPSGVDQICGLLKWATAKHVPITPWGAGSSVTGASVPTQGGVVLDLSELNKILIFDETNLMVKVQAGMMGNKLEQNLNSKGYTLNHSPQSLDRSTPGGWVATRATGQFSSKYGGIEDLVVAFTAILPTGEMIETKLTPRAAIGPDLRHIFIGAEGTMGVVTDVTLKIFPISETEIFEAIWFPDVQSGLNSMRLIMRKGPKPFLVRFYDEDEAKFAMKDKDFNGCVMFLGFDGDERVASIEYEISKDICDQFGGEMLGPDPVKNWMAHRFDFSTIENQLDMSGGLAETIEISHFWDGIYETYSALKTGLSDYADHVLGHFSHVYQQGTSLYIILLGKTNSDEEAEKQILKIWDVAMEICLETGAAISHHHGIGLVRANKVRKDLASSALLLDKLKSSLDPSRIMNPGKLGL